MTRSRFDELLAEYLQGAPTIASAGLQDLVRRDLRRVKQRRRRLVSIPTWADPVRARAMAHPMLAALAMAAIVSFAPFLIQSGGHAPSASPSSDSGTHSAQERLEAHEWQLDFRRSALSPSTPAGGLAAFVRFQGGALSGGAGVGGGCDRYDGRYTVDGESLRVSLDTGGSDCGAVGLEIRRRLASVQSLTLSGCANVSCETLNLLGDEGQVLLVLARR
jgi:hypothetical protein